HQVQQKVHGTAEHVQIDTEINHGIDPSSAVSFQSSDVRRPSMPFSTFAHSTPFLYRSRRWTGSGLGVVKVGLGEKNHPDAIICVGSRNRRT
ncbi:MAG: hypothetical protein ABFC77_02450, partial [Thermoguttaceae bacterium]